MRDDIKLQEIEDIFRRLKKNDTGINGIGIGKKTTNGVTTDVDAIVISVYKKLSPEQLEKNKVIAKTIAFDGQDFRTDVVEAKCSKLNACNDPDADNLNLPNQNSQIYYNRADLPYLSGGCNFAKWTPAGADTFCTLGGIFKDNIDQSYVALTNTHCLDRTRDVKVRYYGFTGNYTQSFEIPFIHPTTVREYGIGEFYLLNNQGEYVGETLDWQQVIRNNSFVNTNYYQPSRYATGDIPSIDVLSGTKAFGFFKRATPYIHYREFSSDYFNYTDAAILGVVSKINATSKTFIGFTAQPTTIQFATDVEINRLISEQCPLFFSGSRSGPVGFPGNPKSCNLKATKLYSISEIKEFLPPPIRDKTVGGFEYIFSDCIEFEISSPFTTTLRGGDSGSILWALIGGSWKIVGLVFASLNYSNSKITGLACRITNVAKDLNISPWNGETLNISKPLYEVTLQDELPVQKPLNVNQITYVNSITGDDNKVYFYCGTQETTGYNDIKFKY